VCRKPKRLKTDGRTAAGDAEYRQKLMAQKLRHWILMAQK
jgi:hypothetical protein